jgi:hypothetical protein
MAEQARDFSESSCAGKERFESASDASKAVRAMAARKQPTKAYRCGLCNGWHLSRAKGRQFP